jgi:hypothetical protein
MHLLDSHSTTWAMPLVLFALVIFDIGSPISPRRAWTVILLYIFQVAGMTAAHHHAQLLLVEMASHQLFVWAGREPQSS